MKYSASVPGGLKLVIFDVDGVLTDGRIVIDDNGLESKFFHVKDGHGIRLLMRAGIKVALLTGRKSRVVEIRASDLGIDMVYQGVHNKIDVYDELLKDLNLKDEEAAFAGDDLIDLSVMRRVGLAMAPSDAVAEVKDIAHFVCRSAGGRGAAREMTEFILKGLGRWDEVTARYY